MKAALECLALLLTSMVMRLVAELVLEVLTRLVRRVVLRCMQLFDPQRLFALEVCWLDCHASPDLVHSALERREQDGIRKALVWTALSIVHLSYEQAIEKWKATARTANISPTKFGIAGTVVMALFFASSSSTVVENALHRKAVVISGAKKSGQRTQQLARVSVNPRLRRVGTGMVILPWAVGTRSDFSDGIPAARADASKITEKRVSPVPAPATSPRTSGVILRPDISGTVVAGNSLEQRSLPVAGPSAPSPAPEASSNGGSPENGIPGDTVDERGIRIPVPHGSASATVTIQAMDSAGNLVDSSTSDVATDRDTITIQLPGNTQFKTYAGSAVFIDATGNETGDSYVSNPVRNNS